MNSREEHNFDSGYRAHFNHRFKKSLGQNFLKYVADAENLVKLCSLQQDTEVIEIGCGAGALTAALLPNTAKVYGFEVDLRLQDYLCERFAAHLEEGKLELNFTDALAYDLYEKFKDAEELAVVSNLPYSLTRDFIYKILLELPHAETLAFMLQKEAVRRLTAPMPGSVDFNSKLYGAQAVLVNLFFNVSRRIAIPKTSFHPLPHVANEFIVLKKADRYLNFFKSDSAVKIANHFNLTAEITTAYACTQEFRNFFFNFVKNAFLQRRKQLINLQAYNRKHELENALELLQLPSNVRAEELLPEILLEIALYIFCFQEYNQHCIMYGCTLSE